MHAEFSYAHFEWLIHCPYSSLYCEITEFMQLGARKKIAHFVNMHTTLHSMTLKYQHQ